MSTAERLYLQAEEDQAQRFNNMISDMSALPSTQWYGNAMILSDTITVYSLLKVMAQNWDKLPEEVKQWIRDIYEEIDDERD